MWNLLDNAKFHVENDRADGDIETETSTTTNHHTDVDDPAPEREDWDAVRREQAEIWRRDAPRAVTPPADDVFADEEWFDFDATDGVDVPRDEL